MKPVIDKIRKRLASANDRRRKLQWRMRNRQRERARPVFIFGSQRSGTTLLGECLGRSPQIENLGESDPRAFDDYSLRDLWVVEQLIAGSPFRMLVLKPLKDSHRVPELLAMDPAGKAIWAYRNFSDRINSAVKKFGRHPLEVFEAFRRGEGRQWQMQGISSANARLIRSIDLGRLTEPDGAALMWWVRNSLYYDLGLDRNARVKLWSYDRFVSNPEAELRHLLGFIGAEYDAHMLDGVHAHSLGKDAPPTIDGSVAELCESLLDRLEKTRALLA